MLIGQFTHALDDKNRMSLPKKFKTVFGKSVIATRGLDKCVFVYSQKEWQKIAERLAQTSLGSKDSRDLSRFFLSGATEIEIDASGRVLLPEYLKEFASLKEKVIVAGLYSRVELWSEKEWEKKQKEVSDKADDVASKLQEIGMI